MRLSHLTFTGADDSVDPGALARLSAAAPLIEWGLLFDGSAGGRPRFPSEAWPREFYRAAPHARRAAHVCGVPLLSALTQGAAPSAARTVREICGEAGGGSGSARPFARVQLNFDAQALPIAVLTGLVASGRRGTWRSADGLPLGLITQHNDANERVHELFGTPGPDGPHDLPQYTAGYAVLFDASGGRGRAPRAWPARLPGLACGYAGGVDAHTIDALLQTLVGADPADPAGPPAWIDIESGVRSAERFDLDKVGALLEAVRARSVGAALEPNQLLRASPR